MSYDDGPIHISTLISNSIDSKRKKLPKNYKAKGLNLVQLEKEYKPNPIIGSAGMLILFDTNAPHHAGLVVPDRIRKVLRFDFEDPCWNKDPIIKKVLSKFKSID